MENNIRITLPEVAETAASIRNYNAALDDILNYVSRIMHDLNSIWLSDGEEMLLSRFHRFSGKFIHGERLRFIGVDDRRQCIQFQLKRYVSAL